MDFFSKLAFMQEGMLTYDQNQLPFFTEEKLMVEEGKGLSPGHQRRDGNS